MRILVLLLALATPAFAASEDLDEIRDLMADRSYAVAAAKLAAYADAHPSGDAAEESRVLLIRAKLLLADYQGALAASRRFLTNYRGSSYEGKVRYLMGEAYSRMRAFADGARIYRAEVDRLSGTEHSRLVAGYYLAMAEKAWEGEEQPDQFGRMVRVRDFRRALQNYEQTRKIFDEPDPARASLISNRIAMSRHRLNDHRGAVAEWRKLLAEWPDTAHAGEAIYHLGYCQHVLGDQVDARKWLGKVIAEHGDSEFAPLSLIMLGETYRPRKTKDEAELLRGLSYWKRFLSLHPSHWQAEKVAFDIAQAETHFGRYDAAITEFTEFLKRFPEGERSPLAQEAIAGCHYAMGEYEKAIAAWKSFLGRWPHHKHWTKVQKNLATAAFQKGRGPLAQADKTAEGERGPLYAKAKKGFLSFLIDYPVEARAGEAQYLLGEIAHREKNVEQALAAWRIAVTKFVETKWAPASLFRIGSVTEKELGDLGKAIGTYEELVKRFPKSGEARTAQRLLSQFREKHLEVATERVWRTDEKPKLRVRTRNIEVLTYRAYAVDLSEVFRTKGSLAAIESIVVPVMKPVWEAKIETPSFERFRLFDREVPLDLPGAGAYILTCQEADLTATTLFLVSDLSIVVKQAPEQTLVFAVNDRTGQPFPGVRVTAATGTKVLGEGTTDRQGLWIRDGKNGKSVRVLARSGGHLAVTGLSVPRGVSFGYSTKAYLYTDRPLYRPGQEVQLKGIVRRVIKGSYVTRAGEEMTLTVVDPRDTVIHQQEVKTGEYGTIAGTVYLPRTAALGTYAIRLRTKDKKSFSGAFTVKEFVKPEFTITTKTDRRTWLPGEEVGVKLMLRYFFGGPVGNTKVKYTVWRGPFSFDAASHEEFAWFTRDPKKEQEKARREREGMEVYASGELRTDGEGDAELTVTTESVDKDQRYLITFEALDVNRRWVTEAASLVVTRRDFFALVKTEKKVYRPGEEIGVRLTTVDGVHFPVEAAGEVQVLRRVFTGQREVMSTVSRHKVTTGEDGRALVKVGIARPGQYRLSYVGEDRKKNPVIGSAFVTVAGETEDLAKHARVVASRQIYREGEMAEVLVNTPVAPVWALLTFEGERVLDHQVVRLTARSNTLRLPMKPLYSPNVFVKVAIPRHGKLHQAGDEIWVFKYLEVTVAPDVHETKPGAEVGFTVTTTDQRGKPVAAEVSFALFDKSILSLAPDGTPQIKPFFYDQRRKLAVKTGSSFDFKYSGNTRPTNRDVLAELYRRAGREKFQRTTKYVRGGKEHMRRGDLQSAVIEFRKALSVTPDHYEARKLLAYSTAELERKREEEQVADKLAESKGDIALGAPVRSLAEKRGYDPAEAMKKVVVQGMRKSASGGGGGGNYRGPAGEVPPSMRAPGEPPPPGRPGGVATPSARRFFDDVKDGDFRARTENVFDRSLIPVVPATLRQRFADTASWQPFVVTGADGKARLTVTLPDNLTTWKAVVRGISKGALVGEAGAEVMARKRLLLRLDAPRFLTQGDRTTVTGSLHSSLDDTVAVRLSLDGKNVTLADPRTFNTEIRRGEVKVFDFTAMADGYGVAELTGKALTNVESDAALTGLPVVPYGLPVVDGRSGEVTDEAFFTFEMPELVVPGTKSFVLTLSPGIDGSVLESLAWLSRFPYGCLEQTVNRFLPAIAADRALTATGSPHAKLKEHLRRAVEQGLLSLYAFQNADGSFGWFSGDLRSKKAPRRQGDPVMTALAVMAMEESRIAGYRVSDRQRKAALLAGRKLVKEAKDFEAKALLLYALSLGGAADLEDLNQLYRYRDGLTAPALSTLALAMENTKRRYNAVALVRLLKAQAITKDGRVSFGSTEDTAWALRALLTVDPESELVNGAVRTLLTTKKGPRWTSTKDTGVAVTALSEHLLRKGVARGDYVVEVWLNDAPRPYQKIHVVGGQVAGDQKRTVVVDGSRLRSGRNTVKLKKVGPGELSYTAMLRYHLETDRIEPAGNLVRVGRRYVEELRPREGEAAIRPGWTIVRPEARPKEEIGTTIDRAGSGDMFRVKLTLTSREKLSYVIVTDPLPAGVEVVEGQSRGRFDWEERRDTRQVFFLSEVPAGKTELSYLVQAIHPGRYRALPTMAYPMYEPEVWGRSGESALTVVPEPGVVGVPTAAEGVTPDEMYQLALRDYGKKEYQRARDGLVRLLGTFRLLDKYQEECQAMLMRSSFELSDAKGAVEAYERLRELNPRRGPRTTAERKSLAVSYQEIKEHERALSLYRGLVGEYFSRELAVAQTYRDLDNPWHAQAFTNALLNSFPDQNQSVSEEYRTALRYLEMKPPEDRKPKTPGQVDTGLMLPESLAALREFLSHHPESSLADEASRTAVTVLARMEEPEKAIVEAGKFIRRYPDSVHLDDVLFYLTESWFEKGDYDQALSVGQVILTRKFKERPGDKKLVISPYARHVTHLFAKIHHLKGNLPEAVRLYQAVARYFEDARDALAFLSRRELTVPETVAVRVGETPSLEVSRKNIENLSLRIYPVDLMLLIAVQKDLKDLGRVDLTGMASAHGVTKEYPKGLDYRRHRETVRLSPADKGAYLVVAHGGEQKSTSIVLVTDLKLSVQEVGKRVRVYVEDQKAGAPAADVFVKVSDGKTIVAQGFTDARGVFEGMKGKGSVMVVAEKDGHYALSR